MATTRPCWTPPKSILILKSAAPTAAGASSSQTGDKLCLSTFCWGILSTARINEALIYALRGAPRSELVAVASRGIDKARAYAAEQNIPTAYGSMTS
ncbi:MAG: hypothetical protein U0521_23775 [Anaerolineae bacterium]